MKNRLLIVALVVGAVATGYRAFRNDFGRSEAEQGRSVMSWSLKEARKDGVLISALDIERASTPEGQAVQLEEAWIEHYAVHRYPLVWFHRRQRAGGFIVVLRPVESASMNVVLWTEDSGASFTMRGSELYYYYFDSKPDFPLTIVASRKREKVPAFVLTEAD